MYYLMSPSMKIYRGSPWSRSRSLFSRSNNENDIKSHLSFLTNSILFQGHFQGQMLKIALKRHVSFLTNILFCSNIPRYAIWQTHIQASWKYEVALDTLKLKVRTGMFQWKLTKITKQIEMLHFHHYISLNQSFNTFQIP